MSLTGSCRFYLAKQDGPMSVELLDGGHSDHEGVARAAKLHGRIFHDEGPWLMVEVHDLPDMDPPINERAADACESLLRASSPVPLGGDAA